MKKDNLSLFISGILGASLIYLIIKNKDKNGKSIFHLEDKININIKAKETYTSRENIFLEKYVKLDIKDVYFTCSEETGENKVNLDIEVNNSSGKDFYLNKSYFVKNNSSLEEYYPLDKDEIVLVKNGTSLKDILTFNFNSFVFNKDNNLTVLYMKDPLEIIEMKLLA